MIENINEKTGEVIEFRTRYNTVPDVGEYYEPGTSMTDATQYESIQSLIQRVVRPRTDLIWSEDDDDFVDAAGFDLADVSDVLDDVASVVAEQKATGGTPVAPSPTSQPESIAEVDDKMKAES